MTDAAKSMLRMLNFRINYCNWKSYLAQNCQLFLEIKSKYFIQSPRQITSEGKKVCGVQNMVTTAIIKVGSDAFKKKKKIYFYWSNILYYVTVLSLRYLICVLYWPLLKWVCQTKETCKMCSVGEAPGTCLQTLAVTYPDILISVIIHTWNTFWVTYPPKNA